MPTIEYLILIGAALTLVITLNVMPLVKHLAWLRYLLVGGECVAIALACLLFIHHSDTGVLFLITIGITIIGSLVRVFRPKAPEPPSATGMVEESS